jgi:hypothetical protein
LRPHHEPALFRLRTLAWGRHLGLALPALVVLGLAPEARAEGEAGWLESYRAPSACPPASSFREQVEQRLSGDLDALARARVSVAILQDRSSGAGRPLWRSELSLGQPGQPATSTEVADGSCGALVQALALVLALRLDAAPEPETRATVPAASEAPSVDRGPEAGRAAESRLLRVGAAVLGSVRSPLGPEPALGVGVGVTLQWAETGRWAPRLEVSASRLATGEVALPRETTVRFDALLATASLCPARLLGSEAFWLAPCVELEAGQLTGNGGGRSLVALAEPSRAPWLAAGASLRAAAIPWGGPIELSAGFGASFPLLRHEFYFAPNIEGFSVPAVGWNGSGQAAWLF